MILWWRVRILKTELHLLVLCAIETWCKSSVTLFVLFALPYLGGLLWFVAREALPLFFKTCALIFVLGGLSRRVFGVAATKPLHEPVYHDLREFPQLQEIVERVARKHRGARATRVAFGLTGGPWQPEGVNIDATPADTLAIPVGCLETLTILELEALITWQAARYRGARWLDNTVAAIGEGLAAQMHYDGELAKQGRPNPAAAFHQLLLQWLMIRAKRDDRYPVQGSQGACAGVEDRPWNSGNRVAEWCLAAGGEHICDLPYGHRSAVRQAAGRCNPSAGLWRK